MSIKQRKIKIEPRINLNHNRYSKSTHPIWQCTNGTLWPCWAKHLCLSTEDFSLTIECSENQNATIGWLLNFRFTFYWPKRQNVPCLMPNLVQIWFMKLLIFYIYHLNAFFSYSLTLIDALDTLLVSTGCILISNLTTVNNWMTTIHVKIKL